VHTAQHAAALIAWTGDIKPPFCCSLYFARRSTDHWRSDASRDLEQLKYSEKKLPRNALQLDEPDLPSPSLCTQWLLSSKDRQIKPPNWHLSAPAALTGCIGDRQMNSARTRRSTVHLLGALERSSWLSQKQRAHTVYF